MAKIAELRTLDTVDGFTPLARFVSKAKGPIEIVPLVEYGIRVWNNISPTGQIPDADGNWIGLEDGERFLTALRLNYHGSSIWATDVLEMPDADAVRPDRPAPDLVQRPPRT